jgi:hypothetical protein
MFEKMRVLGRQESTKISEIISDNSLKHEDIATRTTFIRMTSGGLNAIVMMGGLLKEDGSMMAGYDDIYGPRTYPVQSKGLFEAALDAGGTEAFSNVSDKDFMKLGALNTLPDIDVVGNKFKRPMPGVKSIDVSFKGGLRTLREATISWTCWSWGDLNNLMPHFLAHGKTVMIEWGWVYNKKTLTQLPNFWKTDTIGNKSIDASAFTNYKNKVLGAQGDFDMMVGIIKNFEFTTRDDGGFDCQTMLSSVGVSLFEEEQPSPDVLKETIKYKLSKKESTKDIQAKLKEATDSQDDSALIDIDISVSLKSFISNFKLWLQDEYLNNAKKSGGVISLQTTVLKTEKEGGKLFHGNDFADSSTSKKVIKRYVYKKNAFIAETKTAKYGLAKPEFENVWVRWGWFEDNILSKFLTLVSDSPDIPLVTQFRSLETIINPDGTETPYYESTRIKNDPKFETLDVNKYVLPGQFYPITDVYIESMDTTLDGDKKQWQELATIINNKDNFKPFPCDSEKIIFDVPVKGIPVEKTYKKVTYTGGYVNPPGQGIMNIYWDPGKKKKVTEEIVLEAHADTKKQTVPVPKSDEGYLRNMLINTKLIEAAFIGSENPGEYSIESIDLKGSIESLLMLLNQDIPMWDFQVVTDEIEDWRGKIIDTQITKLKMTGVDPDNKGFKLLQSNILKPQGIFYFPVWQSDSLVKKQNVTAKVPNALALTTMYGANFDTLSTMGDTPPEVVGTEAFVLGKMFEGVGDIHKQNIDIAFRKEGAETIGTDSIMDNNIVLTKDGGTVNLKSWLKNPVVKKQLKKRWKDKLNELNKELATVEDLDETMFDPSVSVPLPDDILQSKDGHLLLSEMLDLKNDDSMITFKGDAKKLREKLKELFGSKFSDDGKMKREFVDTVNFLVKQVGITNEIERKLLIPLEMELTLDGIGGIFPGNSFHSTYLPTKYQELTVFQAFNVNHRVDDSGWTVTLGGKMRSNLKMVSQEYLNAIQKMEKQIENFTAFKTKEMKDIKQRQLDSIKTREDIAHPKHKGTQRY